MKQQPRFTSEDIDLIHSPQGLYALLRHRKVNIDKVLKEIKYELELQKLQEELIKLQNWVIKYDKKVVILFEGRDAAGKGGAIRRITEYINPRLFKIIALDKPNEDEQKQWYFQRYIHHLPKPGEIVFFDRSWYNRAIVEPVNGFCTQEEYRLFMDHVNQFENMILSADTFLIKLYFSIDKKEQAKRFEEIQNSPLKKWKMTPVDRRAQELWDKYTSYKDAMFKQTHTKRAPWTVINANEKPFARLEAIKQILKNIPYTQA